MPEIRIWALGALMIARDCSKGGKIGTKNIFIFAVILSGFITFGCSFVSKIISLPSSDDASTTLPTETATLNDVSLALQMGFSDSHIQAASQKSATLIATRETVISGTEYIAFYLSTEYEPRILNDYSMIVLVYEGTSNDVEEFVYQLTIREPISQDVILDLPDSTELSELTSLNHPATIGYEAAGFRFLVSRSLEDENKNEYLAFIVAMSNVVHVITFEINPSPSLLEIFSLGEISFEYDDFVSIWKGGIPYKFFDSDFYDIERIENSILPDFQPETSFEKALYAIGCNFSSGYNNYRGIPLEYAGIQYMFYSCTALRDDAMMMDGNFDNMVFVLSLHEDDARLLWTTWGGNATGPIDIGDMNQDGVPDLSIYKYGMAAAAPVDYGFDILQFTSDGNLVDLLYGIEMGIDNIKNSYFAFDDLNDDGVMEFVRRKAVFYGNMDLMAYEQVVHV